MGQIGQCRFYSGLFSRSGKKGILKVATVGTNEPFDFFGENGELKGYSIELMDRFAAHAGYTVKYYTMEFSALIPAVIGGKVDMGISNVFITETRKESVLFSEPIYEDRLGIIALKAMAAEDAATAGTAADKTGVGFTELLKRAINRNLIIEDRWKLILNGLGVTVIISIISRT